jgi:CRP/FNR family transcriptional regulator, polysaccharide utilization system transcription regulator
MKKILLIEDNKDMRENTAEILELSNYNVFTAKNGKEGVELAVKEKPDLIICDIMMPVLDGYGVLHMLSKKPDTASIPLIFLTAKAERSDFRRGMEMGADDYVTKPFDDIELLNAVESRLKKSELMKREFSRNMDGLNEFLSQASGVEELKQLSANRKMHSFKKKETIYMEGDSIQGIAFISKGKVKTYKTNIDGKDLITGMHPAGDFIGYIDLFESKNYSESAEALEETEVCFIPKEDFFALIFSNRDVAAKFIKMLSDNIAEKEEQLLRLAYNSVRKRIAEALVSLYNRFKKDNTPANINISREDLANFVGTATETTIRVLSDFKDEKLIEIDRGNITILNLQKLSTMKN